MTLIVFREPDEGEISEIECHNPISRTRSKERLKSGNFKENSLAVRREQKSGPLDHCEDNPLVWSECR